MTIGEFLSVVIDALDEVGIPFMLTGSLASSFHGSPRATQDVDLIVPPDREALLQLSALLRDRGLYVSDDAVAESVDVRGQFNGIDPESGWKADFIVRKRRPFSESEFESRLPVRFLELDLSITRPEDLIVAKLEWAKLGDSERQLRDVADIVRVQGELLDHSEIERWSRELDVLGLWKGVLDGLRGGAPT